jgi:hypothetical protein
MRVRIRYAKSRPSTERRYRNQRAASVFAVLLQPGAVAAGAMAVWRLMSEFGLAARFAIPSGVFSYWQTWLAVAGVIQYCATALNRYGNGGGAAAV